MATKMNECTKATLIQLAMLDGAKSYAEMSQYLDKNAIAIKYIVNENKMYCGARVLLAYDGPDVWADTSDRAIKGEYGLDRAMYSLSEEAIAMVDNWAEEKYYNV